MLKLFFIFYFLLSINIGKTQTTPINVKYTLADSLALNMQKNKYYFYQETAQELTETLNSEEQKCRAIFRWIANNIKFDYNTMNDYKRDRTDPLIVFKTKKAVCAGYASLFQAMCDEVKIKCYYIVGDSNFDHAWNIAELDGKWYIMDITWASGYVSGVLSGSKFTKSFNEEWWMTISKEAIKSHPSVDYEWNKYILGKTNDY